jgi:FMN reductase
MSSKPLHVFAVTGSANPNSVTRVAIDHTAALLRQRGCSVDVLDLGADPLPLLNPETSREAPYYTPLAERVLCADVFLLGTPDYHGSMSGALKNFLDHFWHEFAGKLFATIVASHEKGLTVSDQLRTVARQCYAWTIPYAVSFSEETDVADGKIVSDTFRQRLEMLARDVAVYGAMLAAQRRLDLEGKESSFMARLRP